MCYPAPLQTKAKSSQSPSLPWPVSPQDADGVYVVSRTREYTKVADARIVQASSLPLYSQVTALQAAPILRHACFASANEYDVLWPEAYLVSIMGERMHCLGMSGSVPKFKFSLLHPKGMGQLVLRHVCGQI